MAFFKSPLASVPQVGCSDELVGSVLVLGLRVTGFIPRPQHPHQFLIAVLHRGGNFSIRHPEKY